MVAGGEGILRGLDLNQILGMSPETVINLYDEEPFQIALGDAVALAAISSLRRIPITVAGYLSLKSTPDKDLGAMVREWNEAVGSSIETAQRCQEDNARAFITLFASENDGGYSILREMLLSDSSEYIAAQMGKTAK